MVLVPFKETCFLQPGYGDPHLGIGIRRIRVDALLVRNLQEDFAAGDHDRAFAAVLALDHPQCLEDRVDVVLTQSGVAQQAKLHIEVCIVVEKNAAGRLLVAPGTTCLLEIVFQGAWCIQMDDQADIRLVNAHSEGVGGRDDPEVAADERFLNRALVLRQHPAVEVAAVHPRLLQKVGEFLDGFLARTEDDRPALLLQGIPQQPENLCILRLNGH